MIMNLHIMTKLSGLLCYRILVSNVFAQIYIVNRFPYVYVCSTRCNRKDAVSLKKQCFANKIGYDIFDLLCTESIKNGSVFMTFHVCIQKVCADRNKILYLL